MNCIFNFSIQTVLTPVILTINLTDISKDLATVVDTRVFNVSSGNQTLPILLKWNIEYVYSLSFSITATLSSTNTISIDTNSYYSISITQLVV